MLCFGNCFVTTEFLLCRIRVTEETILAESKKKRDQSFSTRLWVSFSPIVIQYRSTNAGADLSPDANLFRPAFSFSA